MVAKDMSLQDGDFVGVDTPLYNSLHPRMEVWRGPSAGTGGPGKAGMLKALSNIISRC